MEIEIGARIGKVKAIINEEVIENDIKVEIEKIYVLKGGEKR